MFDIGWQEFILIALVAVMVVGPKDLPRVIRTVGQWIRKARSLASEFQGSLEEMAREADLEDVRKQIQDVSKDGIGASIERHVDPTGEIRQTFEDAKSSTGAEEIENLVDETRRDVRSAADGEASGRGDLSFEELAELSKIPDNSVKPPAAPAAAKPPATVPAAQQPAPPQPAPPQPAPPQPAPASPASPPAAAPTPAPPKPAPRKRAAKAEPVAEEAAKPKRTRRKPAASDGEA